MRRTAILWVLAVVTASYGVPAPFPKPDSRPERVGELGRLQGEWEAVELADCQGRRKLDVEDVAAMTFVITGNRSRMRCVDSRGRWSEHESQLTLDPTTT